ncbi:hypothetical protein KKB43_00945 [Patescibacteria group bacterium]|nr:hypothetical protein [Patescibacteria group bacterium]MBU4579564.1 hypothetical protein [Patescibacteria group bacterium]
MKELAREAGYEIFTECDVIEFFEFIEYLLETEEVKLENMQNLLSVKTKDTEIKLENIHHVWTGHWERLLKTAVWAHARGKKDQYENKMKDFFKILPENLKQHKKVFMPAYCFFNLLGFNRLSPSEIIFLFSSLFIDDSYAIDHYRNINIRYQFRWYSKKLYLINFLLCVVREKVENNFEFKENKAQLLQAIEKSVIDIHTDLNNGNKKETKEIISLLSVRQFDFKIKEEDIVLYLEKYFFPDNYAQYDKIWNLGVSSIIGD